MAMDERKMWREFVYEHLPAYAARGIFWNWPMLPYYTGYEHGTLFDWDLYFEGIVQLYTGFPTDYLRGGLCNFLSTQHDNGFLPCIVPPGGHSRRPIINHAKPFMAQSAILVKQQGDGLSWLRGERYTKLRAYIDYWLGPLADNKVGLPVWKNAGHTGMDNHYERAGMDADSSYSCGVDLQCYLVRECQAFAAIADYFGETADAKKYRGKADELADKTRRLLWDETDGMFYDRHAHDDVLIKVKHVGAFAALWAKVATPKQADRLVREHMFNEKEFWRPYPLPAYAATEPGYVQGWVEGHSTGCCSWRAHTWMPTNYYSFEGLRYYGYTDEAKELAEKTWKLFLRGRFCEYYTSETGMSCGRSPFWGWTAVGLFMRPELELGLDATSIAPESNAIASMRRWLSDHVAG